MEPEPEPAPDGGDVEGVPPLTAPEDAEDLASFLQRKAADGEAPWETEWDAAGFGNALRAGFAALWPAVEAGEAAGCDVVLEAGGERLSAHGIVLTIWSEIFRTTLEDRWRAAQEAAAAPRCVLAVELGPARPADVKDLLRFIYTGSTSLAPDSVMGLLHLSDYYSIDGLKRSCGDYLFRLLGKDQLPALLTIADEYSVRHLRQRCACVLADDFEELLEQGTLWTLSIEVWAELLNQTELAVSDEGTVLDAVLTLASAEHTEPAERPRVLGALLPCVRMPQLGERLISIEQDAELSSVEGVGELVMTALRQLAFPKFRAAAGDEEGAALPENLRLQSTPRKGLASFDALYTSAAFEISNKRRT